MNKKHSLEERLKNYKKMQTKNAQQKGVFGEFMMAKTLTEAKKILWGRRIKKITGWRGHEDWIKQSTTMPGGRNF